MECLLSSGNEKYWKRRLVCCQTDLAGAPFDRSELCASRRVNINFNIKLIAFIIIEEPTEPLAHSLIVLERTLSA
jgi:hypothetical protein